MTKGVRCQRQKWMGWSVLTIFLSERGETDCASNCRYLPMLFSMITYLCWSCALFEWLSEERRECRSRDLWL